MKKTIAVILSALLAATAFSGCGKINDKKNEKKDSNNIQSPVETLPNEENTDSENNENENENENENNTDDVSGKELSFDEVRAVIDERTGVLENDSINVMSVGAYNISLAQYRYYYMAYVQQFVNYYGFDWMENEEYKTMFEEGLNNDLKFISVVLNEAENRNITLNESELDDTVFYYYNSFASDFGDNLITELDNNYHITPNFMATTDSASTYLQKMYDKVYGEGTEDYERIHNETIKALNEDYVRVKHILIQFPTNEDGSSVTDEQKAETLMKAEEVVEKINAGEDFDALIDEYNEDPGMTTNTDGYYFTYGRMVPEFEAMSFELADGEVSTPVETSYGYHIIKRLPVDEAFLETSAYLTEYTTCFENLSYTEFNEQFIALIDAAELIKTENFDDLTTSVHEEAVALIEELELQYTAMYGAAEETEAAE